VPITIFRAGPATARLFFGKIAAAATLQAVIFPPRKSQLLPQRKFAAFGLPQHSHGELMFEPCETRTSCASASPRSGF
jgi:hypothetical protein